MLISDFSIRQPIITTIVTLGMVVFGAFSLMRLEVDEFPDLTFPLVFVAVPYPGASPQQVEREVVDRMEDAFAALNGVDEVTSQSSDGFAQILVTFEFEQGVDQASQDVRDAISGIRGDLPQEMEEPIIRKFDPNAQPILSLVLSSENLSPAELTLLADPGIVRELQSVAGVAQVTITGRLDREMSVNVHPSQLQASGVGIPAVVAAVQAQNLAAPVGRLNASLQEQSIRLRGRLESASDFENLVVSARDGQLVQLGQVAQVKEGTAEQRTLALYNGVPAIGIDITKRKGSSTTTVSDRVKRALDSIREDLPEGVTLEVVRDSGERVQSSVSNVQNALIEGAILTVLVIFFFLNSWRSTVITGLALPISILAAFISVWAMGFTLNTMSLLGLSLAIGILIDDAIVVRENIVRHLEMGKDHYTAAHEGTSEIGLAVTATTLSIVAVFVPVAFMDGIAGQWFQPFALTIACAVLVSLFVSFSLDPMLSAYWPDPQLEQNSHRSLVGRLLARFNHWFDRMADRYKGVIAWALDHRWSMVGLAIASFVGALVLQGFFGGSGFVPRSDRSELDISFETPPGSNLAYTRTKASQLEIIARENPDVAYTYVSVGSSNGSSTVDSGRLYIRLVPKAQRALSQDAIGHQLRSKFREVGGVTTYLSGGGPGGGGRQIALQLQGDDTQRLQEAAGMVRKAVESVPGAVDVGLSTRGQKPELEVQLNRGLSATLGLSVRDIASTLRTAFAGIDAGDWVDPLGETREVTVRLAPQSRERWDDLKNLPLILPNAMAPASTAQAPRSVPLSHVATVEERLGPARIDHLDRERVISVEANVEGRSLGEVSTAISEKLAALQLPPGVRLSQGGEVEDQGEVFGSIFAALGLAILLMYFILVAQFGSFLDPLAILMALPLSLIGVVLALLLTGDTLNIMSLIGIMLLMGIVAKNSILLIDFAKWSHEDGTPIREALIEAGRVRLRPILMTTLSLIAGMFPVALGWGEGADFRAPLGRAVIGGTITSTLLTLLVIPTVYEIFHEWRESWTKRWFGGSQKQSQQETEEQLDEKNHRPTADSETPRRELTNHSE